jgi:hypothetical protein
MLKQWRQSVKATMPKANPNYDAATADQGLRGRRAENARLKATVPTTVPFLPFLETRWQIGAASIAGLRPMIITNYFQPCQARHVLRRPAQHAVIP